MTGMPVMALGGSATLKIQVVRLAPEPAEAAPLENVKYEIGGMVNSRRQRALVVCDMHGRDLRPVAPDSLPRHDGRTVMREVILVEFNSLSRDIQRRLEQVWGAGGLDLLEDTKAMVRKEVSRRISNLLAVIEMRDDRLREILGERAYDKASRMVDMERGRAMMREALFLEFNWFNRVVQKKLDEVWH